LQGAQLEVTPGMGGTSVGSSTTFGALGGTVVLAGVSVGTSETYESTITQLFAPLEFAATASTMREHAAAGSERIEATVG
jgi:hypothetical protein